MEFWQHIYNNFDPVAFRVFSFPIHWYGMMYVLALLAALFIARWIVKKDSLPMSNDQLDDYFIYVEIGVILGARLGYVLFYDTHIEYYLTHPWQMFNPFMGGQFVGIRGMSYHGALIGFLIASLIFSIRHKQPFWKYMDLVAISVPLGYVFGRIGNFLNHELIGRATDMPWGVYVYDVLRHPSQLYEAFLEGVVVFILIYFYRKRASFDGELIMIYGFLYSLARFSAEFFREPDLQIGFICCGWMSMGQALSLLMAAFSIGGWFYLKSRSAKAKLKS